MSNTLRLLFAPYSAMSLCPKRGVFFRENLFVAFKNSIMKPYPLTESECLIVGLGVSWVVTHEPRKNPFDWENMFQSLLKWLSNKIIIKSY